jgi:hypothetical protein
VEDGQGLKLNMGAAVSGRRKPVDECGGGKPFWDNSKRLYLCKFKSQNQVSQKARIGQDGQRQGHDYEVVTITKLGVYARLVKGKVRKYL